MIVALEGRRFAAVQLDHIDTRYVLAHRTGIAVFGQLVDAGCMWSTFTRQQKELVVELVADVRADINTVGVANAPAIPATTSPRTVESLRRKGAVDDDGHLSSRAVLAAIHGPSLNQRRADS